MLVIDPYTQPFCLGDPSSIPCAKVRVLFLASGYHLHEPSDHSEQDDDAPDQTELGAIPTPTTQSHLKLGLMRQRFLRNIKYTCKNRTRYILAQWKTVITLRPTAPISAIFEEKSPFLTAELERGLASICADSCRDLDALPFHTEAYCNSPRQNQST